MLFNELSCLLHLFQTLESHVISLNHSRKRILNFSTVPNHLGSFLFISEGPSGLWLTLVRLMWH